MLLALLASTALAVRPPQDFREEVVAGWVDKLELLAAEGRHEEVLEQGARFQKEVEPAGMIAYEMGLAAYRLARLDVALRHYDDAVLLVPELASARYDRGELHLARGDDEAARADFEAAAKLRPGHWVVHFRLAHLAGRAGRADEFKEHLLDAVRNGFDFRTILDDPTWKAWSRDPELGPVLASLIVVYSSESLLDELRSSP